MCSSTFPRIVLGSALAFFAASLAAAPAVLLEKARLVPLDGAPEGGFGRSIAISGNVAVVSANSQPRAGTLRAEATDTSLTRTFSGAGAATYKAAVDLDNFWITQP